MSASRTAEKAPRCEGSNHQQSAQPYDSWATAETVTCLTCGKVVKFRVRDSDLPPWGRVMPHRIDGSPAR